MKKTIPCIIFIMTIFSGCAEFNQPLQPAVGFVSTELGGPDFPESRVSLQSVNNYRVFTFLYNGGLEDHFNLVNARLFIRERKEGEYEIGDLSSLAVDLQADIYFKKPPNARNNAIRARMAAIKRNGDRSDTVIAWQEREDEPSIEIPADLFGKTTIYFWQVEFYYSRDTLRLPGKPGLWYFYNFYHPGM